MQENKKNEQVIEAEILETLTKETPKSDFFSIEKVVSRIIEDKKAFFKQKIGKIKKEDSKFCSIFVIKNKKNENYYDIFLEKGAAIEEKRKKEIASNNYQQDLKDKKEDEYSLINDYIFDEYKISLKKGGKDLVVDKVKEDESLRAI
jgi:hypothetical protein